MQAKKKKIIKRAVDACLTALLLCLMAYAVTGEALHEWFGMGLTALLIVHHILNFRWYRSLIKGKYNAYRVVAAVVNTLLLASIALTALCGMAMSAHAVSFLYGFLPVSFARQFHLALSYWSFVLMGLHLGLHIPAMAAGLKWSPKVKKAVLVLSAAVSCAGAWLLMKNGFADYLFFRTHFAFFDDAKSAAQVFAENAAVLVLFVCLGALAARLAKSKRKKRIGLSA